MVAASSAASVSADDAWPRAALFLAIRSSFFLGIERPPVPVQDRETHRGCELDGITPTQPCVVAENDLLRHDARRPFCVEAIPSAAAASPCAVRVERNQRRCENALAVVQRRMAGDSARETGDPRK